MTPPVTPGIFRVSTSVHDECVVMQLSGELDYATIAQVKEAADVAWHATRPLSVVGDLADLTF
jgi:anti-anti-sigma regulatory factor